jgi:hypothetical protein
MAKMLPTIISPQVTSSAERKVFSWLETAPGTEDWVVLHSLGIANNRYAMYGEIDFVVLAPKLGVFVLEVKGGGIACRDGRWEYTDRYGKVITNDRNPFTQAKNNLFSLRDAIQRKCGSVTHSLYNTLLEWAVLFPDTHFSDVAGIEVQPWQIYDWASGDIAVFIRNLAKNSHRRWEETTGAICPGHIPDNKGVKELRDMLRGDFDKAVPLCAQIFYTEEKLITLTKEQLKCLDQLEDNPRCLIEGSAGTGKTVIALEATKRASAKKEKTALFCYNRLLGEHFTQYFDQEDVAVRPEYVGVFHEYLKQLAKNAGMRVPEVPDGDVSSKHYQEDLPFWALEALEKSPVKFDTIILDEAQDLLTENYMTVLNELLIGGLQWGRWYIFADFNRQLIFDQGISPAKMKASLEKRTAFVPFRLLQNCRNTKEIENAVFEIVATGTNAKSLATATGPAPIFNMWADAADQKAKAEKELRRLLEQEKIPAADITLLSPKHREASVVNSLNVKVDSFTSANRTNPTFSTVRKFKGMENAVIILTDIDSYTDTNIIYVAFTRARTTLIVFESETARRKRLDLRKAIPPRNETA